MILLLLSLDIRDPDLLALTRSTDSQPLFNAIPNRLLVNLFFLICIVVPPYISHSLHSAVAVATTISATVVKLKKLIELFDFFSPFISLISD